MLDATAAAAIGAYRRYLSPYKGFCCAYRTVTGRRSCSAYALAVVERLGALALLQALPRQFARCKAAYARWLAAAAAAADGSARRRRARQGERRRWWDDCDCNPCSCNPADCISCDSSSCEGVELPCDCSP